MLESGNAAPMSAEIGLSYVATCEAMTSCVSISCANVGANRSAKRLHRLKLSKYFSLFWNLLWVS